MAAIVVLLAVDSDTSVYCLMLLRSTLPAHLRTRGLPVVLAFSAATRGPIPTHKWLSRVIALRSIKVFFLGKKNAEVDNFFSQPVEAAIGLPGPGHFARNGTSEYFCGNPISRAQSGVSGSGTLLSVAAVAATLWLPRSCI